MQRPLLRFGRGVAVACLFWGHSLAFASDEGALKRLAEAQQLYSSKQYFKAARYAFAAIDENPARRAEANAWVTVSLVEAGLEQAASYFFIQTLAQGERSAIRKVLAKTERVLAAVGPDVLTPYLIKHTSASDYDSRNREAYLYVVARQALISGDEKRALSLLQTISPEAKNAGELYQLRATVQASLGNLTASFEDYQACERLASLQDLKNRCIAGQARVLYEREQFAEADRVYDRVAKQSLVWPEILFEQAWNSYRRSEFNRTLGKLVSYKSPALSFVFNPEVDVLRAQSFLSLCLYNDANQVVDDFNRTYALVGDRVKELLLKNEKSLSAFFDAGKLVVAQPLTSSQPLNRVMNRFVRSPSFQRWVQSERDLMVELQNIRGFAAAQPGVALEKGKGFPDFLAEVLNFRLKAIRALAGVFVKNSLLDYYSELISNYEKMSFIRLEMLRRFKEKLLSKKAASEERGRGNVRPTRRDDQYYWSFNGEFWNDELGDYVFGLESECHD
jgi:hypothetical protein